MTAARPRAVGLFEVVARNRDFRYLWLAQLTSQLGDWFNVIATATLVGYLTGSEAAVGGLFAVRLVAPVVVSPLAGVCADLFNRKHLLIASDLARAATMPCFLLIRGPDDVWLAYALTAIQLGLSGFFYPTREAILPDLARGDELAAANVLGMASWALMVSLGTAAGGLVAGLWGPQPAFIIDAFTFLLSALLLTRIRYEPPPRQDRTRPTLRAAVAQYGEGLAYLRNHPAILVAVLHNVVIAALAATTSDLFAAGVARDVFVYGVGGSISLGVMLACSGLASALAPACLLRACGDGAARKHHAIIAGYALVGVGAFVLAPLASFGLALLGIALRGAGGALVWVFSTQLLLEQVREDLRGRVFATHFAMFQLAGAGAALAAGHALDGLGYSAVMAGLGVLVLLPGAAFAAWYLARRDRPARDRPARDRPAPARRPAWPAAWRAALALGVFVIAALAANGYRFGVSDQAVHLPFLLRTLDPSYLLGDPAVDALAHHPSLFWELQAPLTSWLSIEQLYLALHVGSLAALYAGARALARALFAGERGLWAAAVIPALVLIAHDTMGGIVTMDAKVLNRTVALGPLLYALALGARGAHLRGFAVAGLAFWIHPTTASHAVVLLWCGVWVPRAGHRRVRAAVLGPLVFLAAASPLIVKLAIGGGAGGVPFPGPPEWWDFVRLNMYFHIYPLDVPWIAGPFAVMYGLAFAVVGRRFVPRAARAYLVGIAACCAAGYLATGPIRVPQAVFLHLWESTRFLVFVAAACCAAWVAAAWHGAGSRRARLAAVLFALAFAIDLPFFVEWWEHAPPVFQAITVSSLVVLGALAWLARGAPAATPPRPPSWWLGSALAGAAAVLQLALGPGDGQPSFTSTHPGVFQHRFADAPEDVALEAWCREHLPTDALVVLPLDWSSLLGFRYGARRAVLVTLKDGAESVFDLDHNREYRRRVEAVCDCEPFELARYGDHVGGVRLFMEFELIRNGVEQMTRARAGRLARDFGVTHLVVHASRPAADLGEVVYRDHRYAVVRIAP